MKRKSFLLHALSPLHCGTGQGIDVIDLPIARMQSTGIPLVPGTSLKGVLRSSCDNDEKSFAVFGPDTNSASENAGALIVGDARLLLLPVRSFKGTFAWVTSPLLLHLASRDLALEGLQVPAVPEISGRGAMVVDEKRTVVHNDKIYLEDIDLDVIYETSDSLAGQWLNLIAGMIQSERDLLSSRFTLVDDETMAFFWETATQIDARNRINAEGVVVDGALWYEESLPPETILIGQLAAEQSRRRDLSMGPDEVLAYALPDSQTNVLQVGGKATVGRGVCRIHVHSESTQG